MSTQHPSEGAGIILDPDSSPSNPDSSPSSHPSGQASLKELLLKTRTLQCLQSSTTWSLKGPTDPIRDSPGP